MSTNTVAPASTSTAIIPINDSGSLSESEQQLFSNLLRRTVKTEHSSVVSVDTLSARPLTIAALKAPKIGSADAADSTVRSRSALTESVMKEISVPKESNPKEEKEHLQAQRESLVKRQKTEYAAAFKEVTGVDPDQRLTAKEMLELKKLTGYTVYSLQCSLGY
jgi:hypothetical protein